MGAGLQTTAYFILLLGGLIFFHELGHFLVARLMGVRVEKFSIGFGPALIKWQRGHTEYKIAAIPLGGYVKMLGDEPDSEIPEEDRQYAFNNKALWRRTLVVLAGPAFNLLLPFIIFFISFMMVTELPPAYIGTVKDGGPAWEAGLRPGDTITSVGDVAIDHWWQLEEEVTKYIGRPVEITWLRDGHEMSADVIPERARIPIMARLGVYKEKGLIQILSMFPRPMVGVAPDSAAETAGLRSWDTVVMVDSEEIRSYSDLQAALAPAGTHELTVLREENLGQAGPALWSLLRPPLTLTLNATARDGLHNAEFLIHRVEPNTPAAGLGLLPGDLVISVDGERFPLWQSLVYKLADELDEPHTLTWMRGGVEMSGEFELVQQTIIGEFKEERTIVIFGAFNHNVLDVPPPIPNKHMLAFASKRTWDSTIMAYRITFLSLAGLFQGKVKMKEMGGPIMIYDMAAKTAKFGWDYFFDLMVMLSVSLGFINLLPIPILDGGHLFFFLIEAVIRRPVSMKIRQVAAYVGLVLIVLLMVVVFANDIQRNWGGVSDWF